MKIAVRTLDALHDDLQDLRRTIAERAHELFQRRGGQVGRALDDWLCAERETVWRPAVELREADDALTLRVATAGVPAKDLDVRVGAQDVAIAAPTHHAHKGPRAIVHVCEFAPGPLRLSLRLPRRVRPEAAQAEYHDGLLCLTIPIDETPTRRVDVAAGAAAVKVGPNAAQAPDSEC